MTEHRPATGSCARCRAALGLASLQVEAAWYCSAACAEGRSAPRRPPAVPEPRLYGRPRRFFGKRRPKELRTSQAASSAPRP